MTESYSFDFSELLVINAVQHVSLGNVRLDYIPVTQRKNVQKKLPRVSQKTSMSVEGRRHRCFPPKPDCFGLSFTKYNNASAERRVQKVLLNHQGCVG